MSSSTAVRLAGIQPLTTVDWEGRLAAVFFFQGCPWRCRYCHNAHLLAREAPNLMPWEEALSFLKQRQGLLDGVVFSGGEPTCQPDLATALAEVAALGFEVALHTNGCSPQALAQILADHLVSYVAMDLKAPFAKYQKVTMTPGSGQPAATSATLVARSGVPHEFRTTYHPDLLSAADVETIARELAKRKAVAYYLQRFRAEGCRDNFMKASPEAHLPPELLRRLGKMFPRFGIRGEV